ncbi:hypothetical protein CEXT_388331, partial [Caerostris extrusa]
GDRLFKSIDPEGLKFDSNAASVAALPKLRRHSVNRWGALPLPSHPDEAPLFTGSLTKAGELWN